MGDVMRIGNASGYLGDRADAASELVEGGPLDVLTGDWLTALTPYQLARRRLAHGPGSGYAPTFLDQLDSVLGACLRRGIRIVSNAGGLDPQGLAHAVEELARTRGLRPRVAYVDGDDLMPHLERLAGTGERLANSSTGEAFGALRVPPLTANAYLGAFGIKTALDAGADVVVTGRVTDPSMVVGAAAWRFGWTPDDLDALAGATVAGHLVECGTQVTGGNYAFFDDVPGVEHVGFPIVEVAPDGSAVLTKHKGTGGRIDVGTVTSQLLHEVEGCLYPGPDVVTRLDTVRFVPDGPDRVRVLGARGEAPPTRLKVELSFPGGFRTTLLLVLTGLHLEEKAALVERQLFAGFPDGRGTFDDVVVQVLPHRHGDGDPEDLWQAQAELRVTVRSSDPTLVGDFTERATQLPLGSVPGLFLRTPVPEPAPVGVHWPTLVAHDEVEHRVHVLEAGTDETAVTVPTTTAREPFVAVAPDAEDVGEEDWGATVPGPLGRLVGARSGGQGDNLAVGVWARPDLPDPDAVYRWLRQTLTGTRLPQLMPECYGLVVDRYSLANVRAVNFVVRGMLGRTVAEATAYDPQGKGFGEYLRARHVDLPVLLLTEGDAG